jgi:hypothetical protein
MAVITLSAKEGSKPLPYVLARLNLSPGRHRLIGIRRGVLDAPVGQGAGEKPKPADDPYADLRDFARSRLKGQERAVIEALCDAGGELPIADLAVVDGVDWDDPFQGFKDAQRWLNLKLKQIGWRLERRNNAGFLVIL